MRTNAIKPVAVRMGYGMDAYWAISVSACCLASAERPSHAARSVAEGYSAAMPLSLNRVIECCFRYLVNMPPLLLVG